MVLAGFAPMPALVPIPVTSRRAARFSRMAKFAAPFILALTLFTAAPAPAQAGATPTGPSDGMFDCLGDFDIGCRIIGYLFEDSGAGSLGPDSTPVSSHIDSNSIQMALKTTLGFFSNAMLIIAGLMLLYYLIIMVAETAHSGTIGGRETNQLWAPIRLVMAIGLLVPLSSGLNSGQYIVVQIAKWGTGLGSQTWKAFTEAMYGHQSLVPSLSPEVQGLVRNALKTYVCKEFINYYAATAAPADQVEKRVTSSTDENGNVTEAWVFSQANDKGDGICGSFLFDIPAIDSAKARENRLVVNNTNAFKEFLPTLEDAAKKIVNDRTKDNNQKPLPAAGTLDGLVTSFQQTIIQQINSTSPNIAKETYDDITQKMRDAADMYGVWTAGSWFLALTRAQGAIVYAANKLPQATGINTSVIDGNPGKKIQEFENWLDEGLRTYPTGGTATGLTESPTPESIALPFGKYIHAFTKGTKALVNKIKNPDGSNAATQTIVGSMTDLLKAFIDFFNKDPRNVAEEVLEMMDAYAAKYGLWNSSGANETPGSPSPHYGDVNNFIVSVNDTNPFASLVELGHRKIQLAVDYWGVALTFAALSAAGDSLISLASPNNFFGLAPNTRPIANIIGSVGLVIATFFVIVASFAMLAGVFLAFLIPLMPFVRFFYALVTWVASVIEAMICMPLFALAFLNPRGEGFTGPRPRFGIAMLFHIFLRPALTIFGMIGALLIFYVSVKFLNAMYNEATAGVAIFPARSGVSFVARMVFGIFHVALVYISANMCFKMIDHIPRRAMQWLGDQATEERYEDDQGVLQNVASTTSGQITGSVIERPVGLIGDRLRGLGRP